MNEHKYTHAWMNTNIHTYEWTQIYTRMNEHKYTHAWINTHIHLYTPTSLSTIGQFMNIHKSNLTVQWTVTLDRANFKTHSDLRQWSTTILPPSPAHAFRNTSGHKLCNVVAVNARHRQRLVLDSSAVLSTTKPLNSLQPSSRVLLYSILHSCN